MCTAQAGSFMQGIAADRASKANARILKRNADMALVRAGLVRNRGRMEEIHSRNRTKQTLGTARASIAANGFAVDSGSALDAVSDIAKFGELDAMTIRYNAEVDAQSFEKQAGQYRMMAGLERQKGRFSLLAGTTSMVGSLLEENQAPTLLNGQTVHPSWYRRG
ncbi:MAG: hypothetical protein AB2809_07000 [Candidatus Thiodiazotropha sp.]